MSGHRQASGKPKAAVAHVRRRHAHALGRVESARSEDRPAAALDAVRRELAAMEAVAPLEAARRRRVLTEVLVSQARAAAVENERAAGAAA